MDSGVGYSEDLAGKVVYENVFLPNTPEGDNFGHGTHVAGIIAGSGALSTTNQYTTFTRTFHGVAEGVNLLDFQVLNSTGAGTDSAVIAALEQAVTFKKEGKYNIRVINLSLGRPVYESYKLDPLDQAVESAWNAGIVVVAAAGNYGRMGPTTTYGYGTIAAPGNDPRVITVGAMNDMGTTTRDRRPDCHLQFQGADALRPGRQAGSRGAGEPDRFGYRLRRRSGRPVSSDRYPPGPLREDSHQWTLERLPAIERDQHGDTVCQRGGGTADPAEPVAHAGSGEGAADADGEQDELPRHQQLHGPDNEDHL